MSGPDFFCVFPSSGGHHIRECGCHAFTWEVESLVQMNAGEKGRAGRVAGQMTTATICPYLDGFLYDDGNGSLSFFGRCVYVGAKLSLLDTNLSLSQPTLCSPSSE